MDRSIFKTFGLLYLAAVLLSSCEPDSSKAEIGWNGKDSTVRVTDNEGKSFMMNYLLYRSLFSSGGNQNVINHYHSHPHDSRYYPSHTPFLKARPYSVTNKSEGFSFRQKTTPKISTSKSGYSRPSYSRPSRSFYRSSYRSSSSFRSSRR